MSKNQNTNAFSMIADYDGDIQHLFEGGQEGELPILATRNLVMFPGIVSPILIGRPSSMRLVELLKKSPDTLFTVFCQRDPSVETPTGEDLFEYGVFARIIRILEMPGHNDSVSIIVQGFGRCRLQSAKLSRGILKGYVIPAKEDFGISPTPSESGKKRKVGSSRSETVFKSAIDELRTVSKEFIHHNEDIPDEATFALDNIHNDVILLNFVCSSMPFDLSEKFSLLKESNLEERIFKTLRILHREVQLLELKEGIRTKTREDLDEQQREYFLQQQIRNIKEELGNGEGSPEKKDLVERGERKLWPAEVKETFRKELDKLDMLNPQGPEYSIQLNYLQTMVDLPWCEYTTDDLNLTRAQRILDKEHYGMEKVKERILEYMAVLSLRGDLKSPILCLYGPPGVGKTSLGKSIAEAMKRKYVRMSLGGMHDESEIRGHRRTYVGAMPGRIIKAIQRAGSSNPVFILDEIDKVTQNTINGDPSSALLEVLDPEQNGAFHDNYLDVDYDLSKVLFIATANDLNTIPRPLLDRMELIEVSGYITEEKIEIAKRHLIPKEKEATGLNGMKKLQFTKGAIEKIIEQYTRESGVRQLEKQINKALRKMAFTMAKEGSLTFDRIGPDSIEGLLGKPPFYRDIYQGNDYAGVVTGLAWTSVGGEILFIETSLSKGKGAKLTLTGNLGDVMKESAVLALEFVKAHASALAIDYRIFDNYNIHIHVPEGATPKDGPSAGITIATSIASALTQRKVRKNTAMTGEITLRGKVLPVGGIKEKILAAKRAGITDIILCKENLKDIEDIPEVYRKGVTFHFVENVKDVWDFALTQEKVKHAIPFDIDEPAQNLTQKA